MAPFHNALHPFAGLARVVLVVADFKAFATDSIFGRDNVVRQGSLILAGATAAIVPKVEAAVAAIGEYLPTVTVAAFDAVGGYAVYEEVVAAPKGKCKP